MRRRVRGREEWSFGEVEEVVAGFCWWRWRKSWKKGDKLGGGRGDAAAEEGGSWKKGLGGGGFGRIRGRASFSAIDVDETSSLHI